MKRAACFALAIALVATSTAVWGQTSSNPTSATAQVPRLIKFSGQATDASGVPITGSVKLTFSLYVSQQGGSPLLDRDSDPANRLRRRLRSLPGC